MLVVLYWGGRACKVDPRLRQVDNGRLLVGDALGLEGGELGLLLNGGLGRHGRLQWAARG